MRKQQASLASSSALSMTDGVGDVCILQHHHVQKQQQQQHHHQPQSLKNVSAPSSSSAISVATLRSNLAVINDQATSNGYNDGGYDTCGLYYLPPHRTNNKIDLRLDLTEALVMLSSSNTSNNSAGNSINNNNHCDEDMGKTMGGSSGGGGGGKYCYFVETSVDYQKTLEHFYSDIKSIWDVYCVLCRHAYLVYNCSQPKRLSDCHRQTTNTDTEYTIKICEYPYQTSIKFGRRVYDAPSDTMSNGTESNLTAKFAKLLRLHELK